MHLRRATGRTPSFIEKKKSVGDNADVFSDARKTKIEYDRRNASSNGTTRRTLFTPDIIFWRTQKQGAQVETGGGVLREITIAFKLAPTQAPQHKRVSEFK